MARNKAGRADQQQNTRPRRTLAETEITKLLKHTAANGIWRGLDGESRMLLYLAAGHTGYRAGELATLMPSDFQFSDDGITVHVAAANAKAGRESWQFLDATYAGRFREFLRSRPAGETIWPGSWKVKAAKMLRHDLAAAEIPFQTAEGYFDFRAWRHSFVTSVFSDPSIPLPVAMKICRVSSMQVANRYLHLRDDEHRRRVAANLPKPTLPGG